MNPKGAEREGREWRCRGAAAAIEYTPGACACACAPVSGPACTCLGETPFPDTTASNFAFAAVVLKIAASTSSSHASLPSLPSLLHSSSEESLPPSPFPPSSLASSPLTPPAPAPHFRSFAFILYRAPGPPPEQAADPEPAPELVDELSALAASHDAPCPPGASVLPFSAASRAARSAGVSNSPGAVPEDWAVLA